MAEGAWVWHNSAMSYVRYSKREKRRLVREWRRSDASLAEFSRAQRVSVGSLTRWREELASEEECDVNEGAAGKFMELGVIGPATSEPATTPKLAAEVVLPGGVILRVFNLVPAC